MQVSSASGMLHTGPEVSTNIDDEIDASRHLCPESDSCWNCSQTPESAAARTAKLAAVKTGSCQHC